MREHAETLERLGEAVASIGLTGLYEVCVLLQINLMELAESHILLDAEHHQRLTAWPDHVLSYLRSLHDPSTGAALVAYLQDCRWPQPLGVDDEPGLLERLTMAELLMPEMPEQDARLRQAQPEDVALTLPEDVNPELLDGLLLELPGLAADFSASVQRLALGVGHLDDMKAAQRIAHTLKGAGNTVGVRGVATLTHAIEDILAVLSRHETLPNRALAELLLNAADCLEAMSEALLGGTAPPAQALEVLQAVLNWADRLEQEGPPPEEALPATATASTAWQPVSAPVAAWPEMAMAESLPEANAPTEIAESPTAAVPEATLRIPAHLVDELLRLMGETLILTGQFQEQFQKTVTRNRALTEQNRRLQYLTAELEQLVDIRNVGSPMASTQRPGHFDPLELEQYNELNTVTHRLLEAVADSRELGDALGESLTTMDAMLTVQHRLQRNSQNVVLRTRMVPVQTIVPRLQRAVRQTCRLVDKTVELVVRGAETLIDGNVLNEFVDPLMHILRNAIDHGIESAEQRQQSGKPQQGRITLEITRAGNSIVLRCQDDGAGLNLPIIRQIATTRGLIAPDKPLNDEELTRLILLPGFSTRDVTTQTSGRGIGMDVVYSRLLAMKGSLRIHSQSGRGCLMELRLPVTLIATHGLLAHIRDQVLAISSRGIEQIVHPGLGVIRHLGATPIFQLGDDLYEFISLAERLQLPPERRAPARVTPAVLLVREDSGSLRAVAVENITDSRELVVKPLGPYISPLQGIIGAAILGDGSIAPVLDLPDLLRMPALGRALPAATMLATAPAQERPFVLAVDDSLSARRALLQLIKDMGFEARAAHDGLEAIEIINGKRPSLVLTDLEMPQMNGMELTAHLRANQATRDLPVIMITSRSTDKHRREAENAGVNLYVTKPFQEEELLGHIHRLLHQA